MVFGSVGPAFTFYQKKNDTINYFFQLRLIGLGSYTCSITTHRTPPLHICITYRVFGSTGHRANKSVEISSPVYLYSSHSGRERAFDDDVESPQKSESYSDFEEEDEIEHKLVAK